MTLEKQTAWPKTDREWARSDVGELWPEVTAEQAVAIAALVAPEFATGNWETVESESPPLVPCGSCGELCEFCGPDDPRSRAVDVPLVPDQVAYCRELAADRRETWKAHATSATPRTIIAFTGLAGSGKSTAAKHLTDHRGFVRIRFAGPLKAMMAALGCTPDEIDGSRKETPCELLGGKTPRHAMQTLGTEWGRDLIAPDLWIRAFNAALAKVPAGVPVVVDDCRFPNEADAILANSGILVRIERPGAGTASVHSSEAHQLPAVRTLHNTMSERNLREQVDVLVRDLSWADLPAAK
jgi:hypothetical protein